MIEPESCGTSQVHFQAYTFVFSTFHLGLSQSLSFVSLTLHTGEEPIEVIKKQIYVKKFQT